MYNALSVASSSQNDGGKHEGRHQKHPSPLSRSGNGALPGGGQLGAIADPGLRHDELRASRVQLDLAPQVGDVNAQILLGIARGVSPHRLEDLLMRERPSGVGDERAQNMPLDRRDPNRAAA